MSTFTGNNGVVKVGTNIVAETKSFDVTIKADTVEDTAHGDAWKTNKIIHKSWEGSIVAWYDPTVANFQPLLAIGTEVALKLYPVDDVAATPGNTELSGQAIITEKSIKNTHDGVVEVTFSVTGNGALTEVLL